MISQTVEYALRAVVTVAQRNGVPITAQEISTVTRVPGPYLSKLMQGLVRAKVVRSQRGRNGGFVLEKRPDELSVWDVVDAVEPFQRIHNCPLDIASHGSTLCPLHRRLDRAMETTEKQFRETTIADVLGEPGSATPLCDAKSVMAVDPSAAPVQAAKGNARR